MITMTIKCERKTLTLTRGMNQAGEFVRIVEETEGSFKKHMIVIPVAGLDELKRAIARLEEVA